ncbi:MAG: translation initiation factor IF-2 subunit beta [Caldisphaeraceae archaeon]|nr:translation initiation factor IF-2 subunit beta [Caldisphaeraceae archaeon]MEB2793634.1 translation initiation factor IF-2 subunit beta [Caldisphaeraceae archaeon]MEB3692293.1 translation initiation factor IF-2 subunit beta [Caldisphaeraceae archaeon]MEB3798284.1 translation initiation factor IF-2 subunit beta [Caldisphaeraceae archaeon]
MGYDMSEGKEILKDYEKLLSRVYEKIPPKSGSSELEIPEPELLRVGSQTIIMNFKEISQKLKREPQLLSKYLLKELASAGSYDEGSGRLVLNVKVSRKVIQQLLDLFVKSYLRCPTCGSIDTRIERRGKVWVLVCEACGAEQPVKPF